MSGAPTCICAYRVLLPAESRPLKSRYPTAISSAGVAPVRLNLIEGYLLPSEESRSSRVGALLTAVQSKRANAFSPPDAYASFLRCNKVVPVAAVLSLVILTSDLVDVVDASETRFRMPPVVRAAALMARAVPVVTASASSSKTIPVVCSESMYKAEAFAFATVSKSICKP